MISPPAVRLVALLTGLSTFLPSPAPAQSPVADEFNPGAGGAVSTGAPQIDGKIVVGGAFTTLGGQPRNRIGRLNVDGTVDLSFNPGASSDVHALAAQGGRQDSRRRLVRLAGRPTAQQLGPAP